MKIKLLLLLIFFYSTSFSQSKVIIFGKVLIESKPLSEGIVELHYNNNTKKAITDEKGNYSFSKLENIQSAEIIFKYLGYKSIVKKIEIIDGRNELNVNITEKDITTLNEVIIKGQDKITSSAKKLTYKINNKDFIKNTKAIEILNTIPTLYYDETKGVLVDGKLQGIIFIDGVETSIQDLKSIPTEEIDRVEVINNPSAKYGSEFTGAVVNIITKKSVEQYLKGSIGASGYIKNNNWTLDPYLSYKRDFLTIKTSYSYRANNQKVDYSSIRTDENGYFNSYNFNDSKGNQQNFSNNIKLDFTKKSSLIIKNEISSTKFNANAIGNIDNNLSIENFTKNGFSFNKTTSNSSVYSYKIKDNKTLYLKGTYNINNNNNNNTFVYNNDMTNAISYEVNSKKKELSFDIDYETEEFNLLNKSMSFYTDIKYTSRKFLFSNSDYFLNQYIIDTNVELDTEWNKKFSSEIAFTIDNTKNSNTTFEKYNSYFLPTLNFLYHFEKKTDLKIGYSKRILRPSASDLNNAIIIINPGVALQGNNNLNPQIRNYYFLTLSKTIKSSYFAIKLYDENINNNIVNVYKNDGVNLVQTLDNVAQYNSIGMNLSFRKKFFKKIDLNFNSGFDYNKFIDNSENAIIKSSNGITYRGSLSLNTKIIKDKIALSFSANQNGPTYSLLSKRITEPYLFFSASSNILKDKLSVKLFASNLLGRMATGFDDISHGDNFYQKISARNNSTNISLSLVYNFGKKFNDSIEDKNINNDDVRK